MAQQLSPEAGSIISQRKLGDFPSRLFQAYIPSLPPSGRNASVDLIKYCSIVGLLFRAWALYTKGRVAIPRLREIIDTALQKRRERIAGMRGADEIRWVVDLEGQMMMVLALNVERDTSSE